MLSIILWMAFAQAEVTTCEGLRDAKSVAINVAFDYKNAPSQAIVLNGTKEDLKFYKEYSAGFTSSTQQLTDEDTEAISSKRAFLARLSEMIKDKSVVNFNYSGHGFRDNNGEFNIVLPGIDAKCFAKPSKNSYRGLDKNQNSEIYAKIQCDKYVVTASELGQVFKDKKVFGVVDSCYSGALDLGSGSSMAVSTQPNQEASDGVKGAGGLLVSALKNKFKNVCDNDADKDGDVSFAELTQGLPAVFLNANAPLCSSVPPESECQKLRGLARLSEAEACAKTRGLARLGCIDSRGLARLGDGVLFGGVEFKPGEAGQVPGKTGDDSLGRCFSISANGKNNCDQLFFSETATLNEDTIIENKNDGSICSLKRGTTLKVPNSLRMASTGSGTRVLIPESAGCKFDKAFVKSKVLVVSQPIKYESVPILNKAPDRVLDSGSSQ